MALLARHRSIICDRATGDRAESTRWASLAESASPTPSCTIVALCRLAALFGRYGEVSAHAYFVDKACEAYDALTRYGTLRDEPSLPLSLAEEVAYSVRPEGAAPLLTFYSESLAPRMHGHADEMRLEASRKLVEGHLEESRGSLARSQRAYAGAFSYFKGVGFHRRAAIAAYRLAVLTDDDVYRAFIGDALAGADDSYWVKARLAEMHLDIHLSDRHTQVLRLVAQGMTNKEIAASRGVSFFTARNMVRELLALFGVRTRGELAALAAARDSNRPHTSSPSRAEWPPRQLVLATTTSTRASFLRDSVPLVRFAAAIFREAAPLDARCRDRVRSGAACRRSFLRARAIGLAYTPGAIGGTSDSCSTPI